jgi:hypothetical protein
VTIGYSRKKVIRSQSAKNGLILYEDFELRNEVTVTFPIEGIFQNFFYFKLPHTHGTLSLKFEDRLTNTTHKRAAYFFQSFSSVPPFMRS